MALTLTAVIAAASSWPVEAAVVKPPIHIGSLQYTNVAGTAGNYSGRPHTSRMTRWSQSTQITLVGGWMDG